jgi:hypothetical protein
MFSPENIFQLKILHIITNEVLAKTKKKRKKKRPRFLITTISSMQYYFETRDELAKLRSGAAKILSCKY